MLAALLTLLGGRAFAVCPPGDYTLDLGSSAVVQASGLDAREDSSTFYDACVDANGWTLKTARLDVLGNDIHAADVMLNNASFAGHAATVSGPPDRLVMVGLSLAGAPTAGLAALGLTPGALLSVAAASGELTPETLTLNDVEAEEQDAQGRPSALANGRTLTVSGGLVRVRSVNLQTAATGLSAEQASGNARGLSAFTVRLDLSRLPGPSNLALEASALDVTGSDSTWNLRDVTFSLYGLRLPLTLPTLAYSVSEGLKLPFTLAWQDGLVVGFQDQNLGGGARATFLLLGAPLNTTLNLGIRGQKGGWLYSFGQYGSDSLRFRLASAADTGPFALFNLDTGSFIGGALGQPSAQVEGGYRRGATLGGVQASASLEGGLAGQMAPAPANDLFARLGGSLSRFEAVGAANAQWTAWASVTGFQPVGPTGPPLVAAGGGAAAQAGWSSGPFNVNANIALTQSFAPSPIAAFETATAFTGTASAAWRPAVSAPNLGFRGVALRDPAVTVNATVNLFAGVWTGQAIGGSVALDVFSGLVLHDRLGQGFAWPLFTLTPSANYDFAIRQGSVGAALAFGDGSLLYSLSVRHTLDPVSGGSWRFGASVALR